MIQIGTLLVSFELREIRQHGRPVRIGARAAIGRSPRTRRFPDFFRPRNGASFIGFADNVESSRARAGERGGNANERKRSSMNFRGCLHCESG